MIWSGNIYAGLGGSTGIPLSLTTIGTSGISTYDPATGILNIPDYTPAASPVIIGGNDFPGNTTDISETIVNTLDVTGMYRVNIAVNLMDGTGTIDTVTFSYNNRDSEGVNLQPYTGALPLNTGNPDLLAQSFCVTAVAGSAMAIEVITTGDVLYNATIVIELLLAL